MGEQDNESNTNSLNHLPNIHGIYCSMASTVRTKIYQGRGKFISDIVIDAFGLYMKDYFVWDKGNPCSLAIDHKTWLDSHFLKEVDTCRTDSETLYIYPFDSANIKSDSNVTSLLQTHFSFQVTWIAIKLWKVWSSFISGSIIHFGHSESQMAEVTPPLANSVREYFCHFVYSTLCLEWTIR